jgi:hypothetical protein
VGSIVLVSDVLFLNQSIWAYSGHYKPSSENLGNFMNFLEDNGVDLKVKVHYFSYSHCKKI